MDNISDTESIINDTESIINEAELSEIEDIEVNNDIELPRRDKLLSDDIIEDDIINDEDYTVIKKSNIGDINNIELNKTNYIVKPENRMTSEFMTLYEYSTAIGYRATHIANGAPIFTDIGSLTKPIDIAKKELLENLSPLYVLRQVRNSTNYELWLVNEMIKPIE